MEANEDDWEKQKQKMTGEESGKKRGSQPPLRSALLCLFIFYY